MTTYRVETLEGALLDAAVSKAEGYAPEMRDEGELVCYCLRPDPPGLVSLFPSEARPYAPSTNWSIGGPILEREGFELRPDFGGNAPDWTAMGNGIYAVGQTPLVAIMRAYVTSRLGNEVNL